LAVDNDRNPEPSPAVLDEPQRLPRAVRLLIWAGGAVVGWSAIALLIRLI
jgi:hypothetical protein